MAAAVPYLLAASVGVSGATAIDARNQRKKAENQARADAQLLADERAKPPPAIPDPVEVTRGERRRSIAAQMRRRGRASTMLTDTDSGGTALGA